MKRFFATLAALCLACSVFAGNGGLTTEVLGTYATGIFDESATEIGAYDAATQRLFVVNGDTGGVDVLDISNPAAPSLAFTIDLSGFGDGANSIATYDGIFAAAVEADPAQNPGRVVFFNSSGAILSSVTVGALPDMLTFTPDGQKVVVANEGEPDDDYVIDPEGSVSIIDVSNGAGNVTQNSVSTATFTAFNNAILDPSIRIFGPGATVAQDLEPEYIAVSPDSSTAYVVCQENNTLAVVNLNAGAVTALVGLGFKDHSLPGNGFDASNRDDAINIQNWPVFGMYQPDAIEAFQVNGTTYLITANEGDARDYDGFSEEERVGGLLLDPDVFGDGKDRGEDEGLPIQADELLGRLNSTTTLGNTDDDPEFEEIYAYGARSFTIWNTAGDIVYDSGDDLEQITAAQDPDNFNSTNDDNDSFDNRSDDKGPEPEGVEVAMIGGVPYAFLGLERVGGFMIFDLSDPTAPVFIEWINNRDFSQDAETAAALDLGPEGLTYISAVDSPIQRPMLAVMSEVSGTTTLYSFTLECADPQIAGIAPIGQNGITISGTPDCIYEVTVIDADGSETDYTVVMGPDGVGILDVPVEANAQIQVFQEGSNVPSATTTTVPTLGFWGFLAMVTLLAGSGVYYLSRRRRQA